ncbi:MAG: hypothetical protein Q9222_001482 [Ikaeria aurantiellina]
MVDSFHITTDEHQIGLYAGLVTAAFAFAEFSTGMFWGRMSDKVGRKPVLIMGLVGTLLSMLAFGFARSLPLALLGRALGGALNGNMGVLATTVAEIVTVKDHQARAYAAMPIVWSLGSIVGPLIGGSLAEPCKNYPGLFARGTLFDRYPFLLPNIVCAGILVVGIVVGILFLEETHREKRFRRDIGLEFGKKLSSLCRRRQNCESFDKCYDANLEEACALLEDEPPPGYRTTEGSPRYPASRSLSPAAPQNGHLPARLRAQIPGLELGRQQTWTKPIILHLVSLGFLAFHTISFDQLMPIFLSSKVSTAKPSLPFHFVGGFGMSSKDEGILMVMQGFYAMFAQGILFPCLAKRFTYLQIFRAAVTLWPVLYFLVPYIVLLPQQYHLLGICFCLLWRTTAHALTFPSNNVMVANCAPSKLVLGTINGAGGSTASFSRAIGPTITGLLYTKGLSIGVSGLGWWVTGLVCIGGAVESYFLEDSKSDNDLGDNEGTDHSTAIDPLSIDAAIAAVMRPEDRVARDLSPPIKYIRDLENDSAA